MQSQAGRVLLTAGLGLAGLGLLLMVAARLHLPLGHLPGDFTYRGRRFTVYFPWVTMLLLSLLATVVLSLFHR